MQITIEELEARHIEDAAALLALRWQSERRVTPELSPTLEDAKHAAELLKAALMTGSPGVVAMRNNQLVGYLLGSRVLPPPSGLDLAFYRPRSVLIKYAWHAVAPGCSEVYRDLYAASSARWLSEGYLAHYLVLPAGDKAAREEWSYLGFGVDMARALRDSFPPPAPLPSDREIRQATPSDLPEVLSLLEGLGRFQANPPISMPFLLEPHHAQAPRLEALLGNPKDACFLAYEGKKPVGLQIYQPLSEGAGRTGSFVAPLDAVLLHHAYTTPEGRGDGVGTALLTRGLIWAIERTFRSCTVGWMTANGQAHRFWLKRGFRPYRYRMSRIIDERVLWAR